MDAFASQTLINLLQSKVQEILEFVRQELINEYEEQGHRMTGALADQMRVEITKLSDGVMGVIWINDYYKYLDKGVAANRIPFNPGSGKKRSQYIEGLIQFFRIKLGLDGDEAKSAAFATAWKQKEEGMPTRGSYAFSKNGRRTDFFTGTILRTQKAIQEGIEQLYIGAMNSVIHELNAKLIGEITITL